MAEDLSNLRRNFSLSEEESLVVEAMVQGLPDAVNRGRACLVGKLIADHIIDKDAIKPTLIRCWRPSRNTMFKALGDNIFLVEFENVWDKSRVLEGRPWIFEGNLFSVEDFNETIALARMAFD